MPVGACSLEFLVDQRELQRGIHLQHFRAEVHRRGLHEVLRIFGSKPSLADSSEATFQGCRLMAHLVPGISAVAHMQIGRNKQGMASSFVSCALYFAGRLQL